RADAEGFQNEERAGCPRGNADARACAAVRGDGGLELTQARPANNPAAGDGGGCGLGFLGAERGPGEGDFDRGRAHSGNAAGVGEVASVQLTASLSMRAEGSGKRSRTQSM